MSWWHDLSSSLRLFRFFANKACNKIAIEATTRRQPFCNENRVRWNVTVWRLKIALYFIPCSINLSSYQKIESFVLENRKLQQKYKLVVTVRDSRNWSKFLNINRSNIVRTYAPLSVHNITWSVCRWSLLIPVSRNNFFIFLRGYSHREQLCSLSQKKKIVHRVFQFLVSGDSSSFQL